MVRNPRFLSRATRRVRTKVGVDMYMVTACLQLIILVFIVLFITSVSSAHGGNIAEELQYNQFSGTMVSVAHPPLAHELHTLVC